MNAKIAAGFLAGVTAAVGIPVFAQTGTTSSSSEADAAKTDVIFRHKGPVTQEQLQEALTRERALLANMDALVAIHKDALTDHVAALEAAATIEDDDAREEAVRDAHEAMRAAVEEAVAADPALADLKGPMLMGFGPDMGGHHGRGGPHMKGMLEDKLGMTHEEIRAAIESGRTIEELAEEKGVELPEDGFFMKRIEMR